MEDSAPMEEDIGDVEVEPEQFVKEEPEEIDDPEASVLGDGPEAAAAKTRT